ncbi:MAG: hypothetical protein ABIS50_17135 [Luteolibacter sp.]|uniref:hypothetical protein n=1 Tax=Luteolibacter sp. TaxID=1962973 RepID=UPI003265242E
MNPESLSIEAASVAPARGHTSEATSTKKASAPHSSVSTRTRQADPDFVQIDGEPFLCIRDVDRMPPFLMSVVSDSDGWLFVGSNGGFTAGRGNPDQAIFPYQTADRILAQPRAAGVMTVILVDNDSWVPWSNGPADADVSRHLYKHACGTKVVFEEIHHRLGLRLRWSLENGEKFGLIRSCVLENLHENSRTIRMLDGWHHLLPAGVTQDIYARYSYLASAYMRHEVVPGTGLGIYTLNCGITDRAEPCESLRVTCAWTLGHHEPVLLLSDRQLNPFRRGQAVVAEKEVRGEFGAHLVATEFKLAGSGSYKWFAVAAGSLDHAGVVELKQLLANPAQLAIRLRADMNANLEGLKKRIAGADGLQQTADRAASVHHFANVLFNSMRGGILADGYHFTRTDFIAYLKSRNSQLLESHQQDLSKLPERDTLARLEEAAANFGDPQLVRLANEYLPLSFSRRHGDPSRPWNRFEIHTKDGDGQPLLGYSGNWRDIFQNWETLAHSYPLCFGSMISVFLNASTADGYNPYRITREGIDWEVHNPKDPWSHIGYWGDHQIIYLLRLLEGQERFQPGKLASSLNDSHYAYANVPYEIRGLDDLMRDPRHSIDFNEPLHEHLMARASKIGGDGKLLAGADGRPEHVTLAEKLLVPLLVKLGNFVPGGGIWLNTQRPEWNDANNALAGWGLSVVTVCYLRRYLGFLDTLLDHCPLDAVTVSEPVIELLDKLSSVLPNAAVDLDDAARFKCVVALGRAGEVYRKQVYQRKPFAKGSLKIPRVRAFIAAALKAIDVTLVANRRDDGLFHSYNLLGLVGESATVSHLQIMLEGQVAALSSGLLDPKEASQLLTGMRCSEIYREDQNSYLLYPDKKVAAFLDRNMLPTGWERTAPLLATLVAAGQYSLVRVDGEGNAHFNADLTNERDLRETLDRLARNPEWESAVNRDREAVLALWEEVFRHHAFTGRSGAMFAFEGLGSIYWHMIAKLLLAVQELHVQETRRNPAASGLAEDYEAIRNGLGFTKDARTYGAFPTDPYSHSPRHQGAQQPGMTGQVKEEILTRMGELGVSVTGGALSFEPTLLKPDEFFAAPHVFEHVGIDGGVHHSNLVARTLAFTLFQVPVFYQIGHSPSISVEWHDGATTRHAGSHLPVAESRELFERSGRILRLSVIISESRIVRH